MFYGITKVQTVLYDDGEERNREQERLRIRFLSLPTFDLTIFNLKRFFDYDHDYDHDYD